MATTLTGQMQTQNVSNNQVPTEGPKVIPVTLDFSAGQSFLVNLSYQQQQLQISQIQSVYIDNSLNAEPLVLSIGNNLQSVSIPGGMQGYLNIDCPNPPIITATCTGGERAKVIFQNFEAQPILWSSGGAGASGPLVVSDPILESAIANGAMNVNVVSGGGGGSGAPAIPTITTGKVVGSSGNPSGLYANGDYITLWGVTGWNQSSAAVFVHVVPHYANPGGNTDQWCFMVPPGESIFHDFSVYGLPFNSANAGLSCYISSGGADGDVSAVTGECGFMLAFSEVQQSPY
jgi:hypothetical protein